MTTCVILLFAIILGSAFTAARTNRSIKPVLKNQKNMERKMTSLEKKVGDHKLEQDTRMAAMDMMMQDISSDLKTVKRKHSTTNKLSQINNWDDKESPNT